jgi:hypothetical protein
LECCVFQPNLTWLKLVCTILSKHERFRAYSEQVRLRSNNEMNFGCQLSCQSFRSARPESRMDTNFRMFHSRHTKFHSTSGRQIQDSIPDGAYKWKRRLAASQSPGRLFHVCSLDALAEGQRVPLLPLTFAGRRLQVEVVR